MLQLKESAVAVSDALNQMLAARKVNRNNGANSGGTSSVMEAMKSFYDQIDIKSLPKAVKHELEFLDSGRDDYALYYMLSEVMGINYYVNGGIQNIIYAATSPGFDLQTNVAQQQQRLFSSVRSEVKQEIADGLEDDDETQADHVLWSTAQSLISGSNRYVIHETDDGFDVEFTPGNSGGPQLKTLMNACGRYPSIGDATYLDSTIERQRVAWANREQYFAQVDRYVEALLANISRLVGTDVSKISSKVSKRVPLTTDFSSLFSHNGVDLPLEERMMPRTGVSEDYSHYADHWELSIQVFPVQGSRNDLKFNVSKLSTVQIMVMPVLRISKGAACYLTQTPLDKEPSLSALHTWLGYFSQDLTEYKGKVPDYVTPISANFGFTKKKEALGIRAPNTRADSESGIFVNFEGRYTFCPATDEVDSEVVIEYERALERALRMASELGEPLDLSREGLKNTHGPDFQAFVELKYEVLGFSSSPLISNWDLNVAAAIDPDDPTRLDTFNMEGGCKPNILSVRECLMSSVQDGFSLMLSNVRDIEGLSPDPETFIRSSMLRELPLIRYLGRLFGYLRSLNAIRPLNDYLKIAARDLKMPDGAKEGDFEYGLYNRFGSRLMSADCLSFGIENLDEGSRTGLQHDMRDYFAGNLVSENDAKHKDLIETGELFERFVKLWTQLIEISSSPYSLDYDKRKWREANPEADDADFDIAEDAVYHVQTFSSTESALWHILKFNNYIVGRAFTMLCRDLFQTLRSPKNAIFGHTPGGKPVINGIVYLPTFRQICEEVAPFLALVSHYLPKSISILQEAAKEYEKLQFDPTVSVSPVPGAHDEFSTFGHQYRALQIGEKQPRVIFYDIAPGGGKTITGLSDILINMSKGDVKRPLIVAPNDLLKNWMCDLNSKITYNGYNCIPITTQTISRWGEEKITQMVKEAPPNTIFLTDLKFAAIHTRKLTLQLGTIQKEVYANMEYLKQFGFDMIVIDECHLLKNATGPQGGSVQSRLFAQLTLDPSVKFVRMASGTLIPNDLDDIIGEARMVDPSIFRTHRDFLATYLSDDSVTGWKPEAAARIRRRLGNFVAVSRAKRKDWAYALPVPQETDPFGWAVEMDPDFAKVYQYVLHRMLGEIENNPELKQKLKKAEDKENREGEDYSEEDDEDSSVGLLDVYISRLEQFLSAPEEDPENGWEGLDFSKLQTPKMPRIIKLLDEHFADRKRNPGKVLIFVRHKSSMRGIFHRLPEKYQKMALMYDASMKESEQEFLSNEDVQIMVCVEQSINTGKNLQIASRLIRAELPWSPGDVDQGMSRVFRPDVGNKFGRFFVDLDWIVVNGTLEVPKAGRLISKIVNVTKFNEWGSANPAYQNLPSLTQLTMNLSKLRDPHKKIDDFNQIKPYLSVYRGLQAAVMQELVTERAKYFDAEGNMLKNPFIKMAGGPKLEGAKDLAFTPLVSNLEVVNDHYDDGLMLFTDWINLDENKHYRDDPSLLTEDMVFCYTDFGYGYIDRVPNVRAKDFSISLKYSYGKSAGSPASLTYVATRVKQTRKKTPQVMRYLQGGFDPTESNKLYVVPADGGPLQPLGQAETNPKIKTSPKPVFAEPPKPPVAPATPKPPKPAVAPVFEEVEDDDFVPENTGEDDQLYAYANVFNGMLSLSFNAKDPDIAEILGELNFKTKGQYVGIRVKNAVEYDKAIAFVQKRIAINSKTLPEIEAYRHQFTSGKDKVFDGMFNPNVKNFMVLKSKPSANEESVKLYPLVHNQELWLVFDAKTNPLAVERLKGKKPLGVNSRFTLFEPMLVGFFNSKKELMEVATAINREIAIINFAEMKEDLKELQVRAKR